MTESKVDKSGLNRVARALCEHHASICQMRAQDAWRFYADSYKQQARIAIEALHRKPSAREENANVGECCAIRFCGEVRTVLENVQTELSATGRHSARIQCCIDGMSSLTAALAACTPAKEEGR